MQARSLAELAACENSKVHQHVHVVRGAIGAQEYRPTAYVAAVADRPRRVLLAEGGVHAVEQQLAEAESRWRE